MLCDGDKWLNEREFIKIIHAFSSLHFNLKTWSDLVECLHISHSAKGASGWFGMRNANVFFNISFDTYFPMTICSSRYHLDAARRWLVLLLFATCSCLNVLSISSSFCTLDECSRNLKHHGSLHVHTHPYFVYFCAVEFFRRWIFVRCRCYCRFSSIAHHGLQCE